MPGWRRRKSVCRHRAGDGETARSSGRARVAGQAHQSGQPRIRLVAVSRRDLRQFRARRRPARARPLRTLSRLSRRLPDRRLSRALSARRAPLHFLSDDRIQRTDPEGAENGDRQSHLRLRRLSRRLSVEQVCASRTRSQAFRAPRSRRSAARRTRRPRRRQSFAKNSPAGRSSESAGRGSCGT